jgi:peptidoglycan/LPS O-acetylase OafA/YrhL
MGKKAILLVLYRVMHVGWLGVDIFFVLSGFLITGIILKDRSKKDFWGNFYLRRAFRILPAFVVVFVVTLVLAHFFSPDIVVKSGYILAATFFMANWTIVNFSEMPMLTHLWSLAVEEQFYFLWPQAAKRMKHITLFRFALILAIASEAIRLALALMHVNAYIIYKITPTRIDGLSIGAALAIGLRLPKVREFLERWWQRIALISAILLPITFLALKGNLFVFNTWSQIFAIPPTIVLVAMLIYGSVEGVLPYALGRFLGNPVLTYLGRRSYAIYLIHEPVRYAVQASRSDGFLSRIAPGVPMNVLLMVLIVAVSLVLSELSWRWIETPAQNLRGRLMPSKPVRPRTPDTKADSEGDRLLPSTPAIKSPSEGLS